MASKELVMKCVESTNELQQTYDNRLGEIEKDYQAVLKVLNEKYNKAKIETLEKKVENLQELVEILVGQLE